ncbi:MAG: phosphatidate cytidylyltransferase [Muribaculaceae bacterium]|nr:phosphatidate cytidylyltransferase [Muribaculaceae bacterium]
MFRTRLLSGIVLVAIAFGTIWAGGWVLALVLCLISVVAYLELTRATGVCGKAQKADEKQSAASSGGMNGLEWTGIVLILLYYAGLFIGMRQMEAYDRTIVYVILTAFTVLSLLIFMFVYVFRFPDYKAGQVMAAFFELIYAPVLLSFLYIIREGWSHGIYLSALIFLCSWGSDTCAYCVGVLFGKHKMTPKLSPKKSVEGAIGGVVGAALLFGLYTYYVINPFSAKQYQLHWGLAMCLGAVGALVSMIGDLAASAIKRDNDIKDYGKLIPGHGGIMDRFDSVIVAAPLIFLGLSFIAP